MKKIFLLLFIFILSVSNAQAQEVVEGDLVGNSVASESPMATPTTTEIFNKTRNTQKIAKLRILYRDQIEAYRKSDKEFNIAKTHYFNVETLTALEEVVNATELVMMDRSRVLITYLELLSVTLEETPGVELALKEESLKQMRSLIMALKIHQEDIILAKDRVAVNILADNFEVFVDQYNQVSYRALILIRIGKIQAVYDVATLIDTDIKKSKLGDKVGAVVEAKRNRAYQEIQRNFKVINTGLIGLNKQVLEGEDSFSRSFYERILEDLEPIYVQISKSIDHLDELLRL